MSEDLKEFCLLPCPHCGSEDLSVEVDTANFPTAVLCCNCLAERRSGEPVQDWNQRVVPSLPPVSPEGLVEGEWYVVVKDSADSIARCRIYSCFINDEGVMVSGKPSPFLYIAGFADSRNAQYFDSIYGPLKFKIGGAE